MSKKYILCSENLPAPNTPVILAYLPQYPVMERYCYIITHRVELRGVSKRVKNLIYNQYGFLNIGKGQPFAWATFEKVTGGEYGANSHNISIMKDSFSDWLDNLKADKIPPFNDMDTQRLEEIKRIISALIRESHNSIERRKINANIPRFK